MFKFIRKDYFFLLVLMLIAIIIGCFNYLTPMAADDYCYALGKIDTLSGIFKTTLHEYFTWNSRFISLFLARFLLTCSNGINVLINTSVFCSLLMLTIVLVHGMQWKNKLSAVQLVFLFGLFWFTVPAFGTVFFWRNGIANYGFPLFFILFFLVPYRFLIENPHYSPSTLTKILHGMISFLAGLSNENSGIVVFILAACVCFVLHKRGHKVPLWAKIGVGVALIGWLILILAPGPYVRLQHPVFLAYREMPWFDRIVQFSFRMLHWQILLAPQYLIIGAVFWFNKNQQINRTQLIVTLSACGASILSLGAFVLSVAPPERALTSAFIFFSIATYSSLFIYENSYHRIKKNRIIKLLYVILLVTICSSVLFQLQIFLNATGISAKRMTLLHSGSMTVALPPYEYSNKYFFIGEEIGDVNCDKSDWINSCMSKYFNIDTVTLETQKVHSYLYNDEKTQMQLLITPTLATIELNPTSAHEILIYYQQSSFTFSENIRFLARKIIDPTILPLNFLKLLYKPSTFHKNKDDKLTANLKQCDSSKGVYIAISGEERLYYLKP